MKYIWNKGFNVAGRVSICIHALGRILVESMNIP